jgi:hypothetical protein
MNPYRSLATSIGTVAALQLAQRLAIWHDAMVMHGRGASAAAGARCEPGCPHIEAQSLWQEALEIYGDGARELRFLRMHGESALDRQPAFSPMEAYRN